MNQCIEPSRSEVVRGENVSQSFSYSTVMFEEALHALAIQARIIIGAHQSAISYVINQDFKGGVHTFSFSEKYEKYNCYDVAPTGKGLYAILFEDNNKAMRLTEAEILKHPRWKNFSDMKTEKGLEHPPLKGWLAIPIIRAGGDTIGFVQLSDKYDGEFDEKDEMLLTHFADVALLIFELHYANNELQQFAQIASHDLKEPIATANGYLDLLLYEKSKTLDSESKEYINIAKTRLSRNNSFLDSLQVFTQVTSNVVNTIQIDMTQLVAEVVQDLKNVIDEKQAVIKIEPLPSIVANEDQIIQVMTNLIGNALKYSNKDAETKIKISATKVHSKYQFEISDNGIGIEEKYFPVIFDLFKRLHSSNDYEGTGLGLALVKKIIERNGGLVWVSSTPGQGSTFYFTIAEKEIA
jgi:signal transduction histidine kinase